MIFYKKHISQQLKTLAFPGFCCLCDASGTGEIDLCTVCRDCFPVNEMACSRCGIPVSGGLAGDDFLCGKCVVSRSFIDATVAPFLYDFPVSHIVTSLKFVGHQKYARLMGQLIASRVVARHKNSLPDLLIPVPLHPDRSAERGFNQSAIIAHYCGLSLNIPVGRNIVERVVNTVSQTEMSRSQRKKNMRRAFNVNADIAINHVAIIDDVMTTGSTVNEIARVLKESGVGRVDVWVFARTPAS